MSVRTSQSDVRERRSKERSHLALRRTAQKAEDAARLVGADVAAPIGRQLLQHDLRRHLHPAAVEQGVPVAVVLLVGAGRAAVAFDAVDRAVAARGVAARLFQLLVPVVTFGMALAVMAVLRHRQQD